MNDNLIKLQSGLTVFNQSNKTADDLFSLSIVFKQIYAEDNGLELHQVSDNIHGIYNPREEVLVNALKMALVSLCASGDHRGDYIRALGEDGIKQLLDDTEQFVGQGQHIEDVILDALQLPNYREVNHGS